MDKGKTVYPPPVEQGYNKIAPNHEWGTGIKLKAIAVIGTDCIGRYMITVTPPPRIL